MKKKINQCGIATRAIVEGNILVWLINIMVGGGSVWGLFLSGGGYVKDAGEATFQAIYVQHEWWRLLTCGYLHIGVFHLLFNICALLVVVYRMEKQLGHFKIFLFYHFGIVITALVWCMIFKNSAMVGASLGIYVILGMKVIMGRLEISQQEFRMTKRSRNYLIYYVLFGCLLGIETVAVHSIAFGVGVIFGGLYVGTKGVWSSYR